MALRHLSMLVLSTAVAATVLALLLGACGGDGEESEFRQARLVPTQFKGSGDTANESAAAMTVVDGVKQWDGPPVGLTGGLLINYKDEYRATVRMETLGGQPAGDRQIVIDFWFSDFIRYQKGNVTRTVNNFVFLAREGFYDGHTFTVEPDRMVLTGDPPGPLTGAGYHFDNEPTLQITHDRPGIVSMWNEGEHPDGTGTNSSQWFIALAPIPEFDYYDEELRLLDCGQQGVSCHTPFGVVIEGMDVVRDIVDGDRIETVLIEKLPGGTSTAFQGSAIFPREPPADSTTP